jgi:tRNA (mo5U34)-methyltransferase
VTREDLIEGLTQARSLAAGGSAEAAREAIQRNPAWYHTIEVAPGVVTPGRIDLRRVANRILPGDLGGKRALDVGTFDGFWAFEMERRGADVVSIDVERIESAEWPPRSRPRLERAAEAQGIRLGLGFELASQLLGSQVARVTRSVYDLEPDTIGGPVEFAFSGAIMLHLRDPVRALERIFCSLAPGGELRILEPVSVAMTVRSPRRPAASFQAASSDFNWWVPNLAGLAAWLRAAGFEDVRRVCFAWPPAARRMRQPYAGFSGRRPREPG